MTFSAPGGAGAAKSKRATWDYKGRLQDVEAKMAEYMTQNVQKTNLASNLEAKGQQLMSEIEAKEQLLSQTSGQVTDLKDKIRYITVTRITALNQCLWYLLIITWVANSCSRIVFMAIH